MPLHSDIVGAATEPMEHKVDARWLMAYAAALGDFNPLYMDTQANTVIAHPVFPVCPEWPVILDTRNMRASEQLTAEESAPGGHAAPSSPRRRSAARSTRSTSRRCSASA